MSNSHGTNQDDALAPTRPKLFELIEALCTKSSITNLLRELKEVDPEVRVSGNKEDVVRNLERAVARGTLPRKSAYDLLCDAEENGSQHIFIYVPNNPERAAKLRQAGDIAAGLFGDDWEYSKGFPRHLLTPEGEEWCDFRREGTEGWSAKLCVGLERRVFVDEEEKDDGLIYRTYERKTSREVFLARWREAGFLELRIPRGSSKNAVRDNLVRFWEALGPVLQASMFRGVDLSPASRGLIDGQDADTTYYRLGDVVFNDDATGSARFTPPTRDDDLLGDANRESAIKCFEACQELAVTWNSMDDTHALDESLTTVIGKISTNDVLISSRATEKAVDYIIFRIWDYVAP